MLSSAWRISLLCLLPLSAAGCGTARFEQPVVSRVVNPCDAIVVPQYDAGFLALAADEHDALAGKPLSVMADDYGRMRDAVRACQK